MVVHNDSYEVCTSDLTSLSTFVLSSVEIVEVPTKLKAKAFQRSRTSAKILKGEVECA